MINGLDIYYSKYVGRGLPVSNNKIVSSGLKPISNKRQRAYGLKPVSNKGQ